MPTIARQQLVMSLPLPRVANVRRDKCDVYVGRYHSKFLGLSDFIWGNPSTAPGTPWDIYSFYWAHVMGQEELIKRLGELTGKVIGCWCSPNPCHAMVLVDLVARCVYGVPIQSLPFRNKWLREGWISREQFDSRLPGDNRRFPAVYRTFMKKEPAHGQKQEPGKR